ncbi:MAG: ribulose-phosphate 3-epimerase, partial [Clostridia bacterium]|nr:ribulose-phosphate 3-epimerase [Clostridia bacterium]
MTQKNIAPSLICMDLCNLEQEISFLEKIGCRMLHVDIIDGIFSPDMPLGIDMIRQIRKKTDMVLDSHLMSTNNAPYIDLLLNCGIDRLCFHPEFEARPSILLRKIRAAGVKAGLAISPETTVESVRYLLPLCDFVLLMRIDAGYAHLQGQIVYPQTEEKICILQRYIKEYGT